MRLIADLKTLTGYAGFRKLLAIRLVSQTGDGLVQAGLASLFFFSPERLTTAGDVAIAFAVLLLPFTVVGPFAGPLLDRWRRRQVLLYGNAVRAVLAVIIGLCLVHLGIGPAVYALALLILGVNRFLLSALSAGLPLVVPRHLLLMANSITPTLGAGAAVLGAVIGFGLGIVLPTGSVRDFGLLAAAGLVFAAAATLALRLAPGELGPDGSGERRRSVFAVLGELAAAARYLTARRTPGAALAVMATHRFFYGVNFLVLILASRNLLVDPTNAAAGLALFATLSGISFAGSGLAIIATPIAHERLSPQQWILTCLGIGALSQLVAATAPAVPVIASAAFLLGLSVQGAKIAVDTIVQRDTADAYRGRAFALYDVMFNAAFVGAAGLAAAILPDTGWSRGVFLVLAAAFALLAAAYRLSPAEPADVAPTRV